MAKTLIGNIKGKDGRGITSINKTGTTGSVDTYTITYTDSTTSTFTVNNSDSIALQRQIVPSAAIESSATASQAYEAGDYVVVNGILRKVKSAIAKGNTISDSNSTATTVAGELATLGDSMSQYLHFEMVSILKSDVNCTNTKLGDVTAPTVDGYRFLSWVSVSTVSWVGACYFEDPLKATTAVWCAVDNGTASGLAQCYALYTKVM